MHALFQRRFEGDDALLRLAQLRFREAGLAAEVYAETPEQLEHVLAFASPLGHLPTVHLNRAVDLLHARDRMLVRDFAVRFSGRVWGLVVHDQRDMATHIPELMTGLRELDAQLSDATAPPSVFLEYAAGLDPDLFIDIARQMAEIERVSVCIDVGHVGIRQSRVHFRELHPDLDLATLHAGDPRLPSLAAEVQAAVGSALPAVLQITRSLAGMDKRVHFHPRRASPDTRAVRPFQLPVTGSGSLRPRGSALSGSHVRTPRTCGNRVGGNRRFRRRARITDPGDSPGRGTAAPGRRRAVVPALARPHECGADELRSAQARRVPGPYRKRYN